MEDSLGNSWRLTFFGSLFSLEGMSVSCSNTEVELSLLWLLVYEDETGKKVWQYKDTSFKDVGTMVIRDGDREYYTSKVMAYSAGSRLVYKEDKSKDFDYRIVNDVLETAVEELYQTVNMIKEK